MAFDPPGDMVAATSRPASILLAEQAYVVASRNDTTAAAKSRCEHTVEVTFWIADPPAVSFCGVHCSNLLNYDSVDADFYIQPHVVAAEGRFVLLRCRFASGDDEDEYFMYKADMKSPSLECIPLTEDRRLVASEFGILPRGDGYLLVGLYDVRTHHYVLEIYSSEDKTWRTEVLHNPCPETDIIIPEKMITLGEGILGIVDFWQGMLVCDLLHKPPVARYVPLPDPLPENVEKLQVFHPAGSNPRRFRDLTCSNGVIKFIEMEHRVIVQESREMAPEKPKDPTLKGILYDSDLIRPKKQKRAVGSKPKRVYLMNGWRAVTWTRALESCSWLMGRDVDADDILVDDSIMVLLSGQSNESLGNLLFKNLNTAWLILSIDGDDLLYLKTFPKFRGSNGSAIAIDLANKKVKVEADGPEALSLGRYIPSQQLYQACTLSKHLNVTPGIKVPAFCKITLAGTSVKDQNTTAIRVAELGSCRPENKRPRLSAEKVNLAQNGAQSGNAHILSACPDQNSQPPQMNIYPGRSWWPHNNNLPPQQCFNTWCGSSVPGYAPSIRAPNLSYGNYSPTNCQPEWWQAPPSMQQPAPITAPGPHGAPHPCFNNWYGANNNGYSQQLPGRNLYAYGSRSDYGNYQVQLQQRPHIQDLPAYAALQRPLVQLQHQLTGSGVWIS